MKSTKKAGLITVIIAITIIALILTHTFLPTYIKDRGNLYRDWEKGQWHLNNDDYDELFIEYDYVEGYKPNTTAIYEFENVLREYTDKEDITHHMGDVIPYQDTKPVYGENDLAFLENRYRDEETKGNTLVIYVLYLDGEWKQEDVLGLSYRGTNIVIFMEKIMTSADRSNNIGHGDIETSVLIHEWGHLIGLVGKDYDADHEDTEYPHHCNQEAGRCVMAASVEIKGGEGSQPPPTEFCELCQEDIEEIKNMYDPWGPAEILTYISMGGQTLIGLTWVVSVSKHKEEEMYNKETYKDGLSHEEMDYIKDDEKKYY